MEKLPILTTDSLVLLPAAQELARRVLNYYVRNRSFLEPFEPLKSDDFYTEGVQRRSLRADVRSAAEGRGYRYYLTLRDRTETIIGSAALSDIVRGAFRSAFLGYKLDERLQGRGLMTEAVSMMTQFGFEALRLHRIEANVMPRNKASIRVLEKCGYESEGLSKRYLRINGVWEDHIHMVRLNDEQELTELLARRENAMM